MNISKYFTGKPAQKITVAIFIAILVLAFNVRKHTFNLPHISGDQLHYVGLAFKLDTQGTSGYNLRGINIDVNLQYPNLVRLVPTEDKGHLLTAMDNENITYYDQALHHLPYGFPLAIMLSHNIFARGEPYYLLALPNAAEIIRNAPSGAGLRDFRFDPPVAPKQFYSIIIPLSFSLLLVILTFFLAKEFYESYAIALVAMFLVSISPIDILTSQKLWSDDMTTALMVLAVLFYVLSVKKDKALLAFTGGLFCGLSILAKQSGAFIIFAIIIWHFITNFTRLFKKETFLTVIFDKKLILFGLGTFITAGYWFFKVLATYGSPFYRPQQANISKVALTEWFKVVGSRPWHLYIVGIPYQNPLFSLAYISPFWLYFDRKRLKSTLFLLLWIAVFFYIFQVYFAGGGKEHRYMLPAYPAFAILAGYIANHIRIFLDKYSKLYIGTALLIIILLASAVWCIPMAMEIVFYNGALILKPF